MLEFKHWALFSGASLLAMPLLIGLAAWPPAAPGRRAALAARRRVRGATQLALGLALAADIGYGLGARADLNLVTLPLPGLGFGLPLSVAVDPLTLALASLVAFVAAVIARYSVNYLDGDPGQARFFRLLGLTAAGFLTAVIAGNIGLFALAIIATGFSLNRLLAFYPERPKAVMAAHKKAVFSRTADALLVAAAVLLGQSVGNLQFEAIAHYASRHAGAVPLEMQIAAWLIVAAVMLKSAHFPFHGWLIQVMEAPTPVSALLHAGVVYSGAILALRSSELLVQVPQALLWLGFMGLFSVLAASLVMTTQTAVKSMLAWSTAAQLGFMSLELGLGLFPLALLHLMGHLLYKAHAFLASGSVTDDARRIPVGGRKQIGQERWAASVALGAVIAFAMARLFGYDPVHETAWWALGLILGVALAQILLKGLSFDVGRDRLNALLIALAMGGIYLGLHTLFVRGFAGQLAAAEANVSAGYLALLAAAAAGFLAVSWLQGPGQARLPATWRLALFIHLYNGLYADQWIERFAHRIWSHKLRVRRPRKHLVAESPDAPPVREWITQ